MPDPQVNVFVHLDDLQSGEDGGRFKNPKTPINIPIEVGKCTYILVEMEGYHDWEEAFYPSQIKGIYIKVRLMKKYNPLPKTETREIKMPLPRR